MDLLSYTCYFIVDKIIKNMFRYFHLRHIYAEEPICIIIVWRLNICYERITLQLAVPYMCWEIIEMQTYLSLQKYKHIN